MPEKRRKRRAEFLKRGVDIDQTARCYKTEKDAFFDMITYPMDGAFQLKNEAAQRFFEAKEKVIADAVTVGARKNPWKKEVFRLREGPISLPRPGQVILYEAFSTYSFFPQIYPPLGARPPPGFLINDPTIKSAPRSVGSIFSANSP